MEHKIHFNLGTDTSVNGRVGIVNNASNLEHELANGYNSGDEYTGRNENNLTLAEWQEVSIVVELKIFT